MAGRLVRLTASRVGSSLTLAVLAVIPALIIRSLWLVALAEPLQDVAGATLSANVAGVVTWLVVIAATRRFFHRRRAAGRHQQGVDHRQDGF